ncbi:MAG: DUF6569 family protein [Bryobacteraceae bacterium]|jgi:hypothetical protein
MSNGFRPWIPLLTFALLAAPLARAADDLRISGPFTHDNLSVFLIHSTSPDAAKGKLLTLHEAMDAKKVVVYETGAVNELSIENQSAQDVYIQSGDIVKGGRQDRVLTTDLILPAHSGKLPISSFCVEQGRWTRRGNESAEQFGTSDKVVAFKQLKMAVHEPNAQVQVWNEVANARQSLAETVAVSGAASGGAVGGVSGGVAAGEGRAPIVMVAPSPARPRSTSMQMALESRPVVDATAAYIKDLAKIVDGQNDVVGFVYAINGAVNSGDVYASNDLFRRMWPMLLESSATEALAERAQAAKTAIPDLATVKSVLADADRGKESSQQTNGRLSITRKESPKTLLFETRDPHQGGNWIHRSYVVK